MITLQLLIIILITHWISDFILQTSKMSQNKSHSIKWLLYHTSLYSILWLSLTLTYNFNFTNTILFIIITFICHTITDFTTSKITSKLYLKGDYHNFFVIIGLDQILHYIQLILTFKYLYE